MNNAPTRKIFRRLLLAVAAASLSAGPAYAEITVDGSLGPAGSLPGPDYKITPNLGTTIGDNIFHSFGIFNIYTGERALFLGPDGTENIIGRITGGDPSFIDGLIRSDIPGADIWLINPAGMVFGENASLDVSGGFHASSADYVLLGDNGVYHASDPSQSVLSSAMPSAFGFLSSNPAPINVEGAQLQAGVGEILSLVGGDLNISNGAHIGAVGGVSNLVSLGGPGEVMFDANVPGVIDSVNTDSPLGTIRIEGGSVIDVSEYLSGLGAGAVLIRGGELIMDGSGIIGTANKGDGGLIGVFVDGQITLRNGSGIFAGTGGAGQGGGIYVLADGLLLDGSFIQTDTKGEGEGGDVLIALSGDLVLRNQSDIYTSTTRGNAGDVDIAARKVTLSENSLIGSFAGGVRDEVLVTTDGKGGDVKITAGESIEISDFDGDEDATLITSATKSTTGSGDVTLQAPTIIIRGNAIVGSTNFGVGNSGNTRLSGDNILIADGALLAADSLGPGDGGDLLITATNDVVISGDGTAVVSEVQGIGSGGSVLIVADRISVSDGSTVSASTSGPGQGGEVFLLASNIVISGLSEVAARASGSGDGGGVIVEAESLNLTDGGQINVSTSGAGDSGIIYVLADNVTMSGYREIVVGDKTFKIRSGMVASSHGSGDAIGIVLEGKNIVISNGAGVSASSTSSGEAGIVIIGENDLFDDPDFTLESRKLETLTISGGGFIQTDTHGSGLGGAVQINGDVINILDGGKISANTSSAADGGWVELQANNIAVSGGGSTIETNTSGLGDGGVIVIAGDAVNITSGGKITANTTSSGDGGWIGISANKLSMMGAGSAIQTNTNGMGQAGYVLIQTDSLDMRGRATITSSSIPGGDVRNAGKPGGDAGLIVIDATGQVSLAGDGTRIVTSTLSEGDAGDILIYGSNVIVGQGATIKSDSGVVADDLGGLNLTPEELAKITMADTGVAGNIFVAGNFDDLNKHGVLDVLDKRGIVLALLRRVTPDNVVVHGVVSSSSSSGDAASPAGNIVIRAANKIHLDQGGKVAVSAEFVDGGDITMSAGERILVQDGEINATVKDDDGDGGNINLDAELIVVFDKGRLVAQAFEGKGGNINIEADNYFESKAAVVDASSEKGAQGTVSINAPDVDVAAGVTVLPTTYLDAARLLHDPCAVEKAERASSLVIQGHGGVPVLPDDMPSDADDDSELAPRSESRRVAPAKLLAMATDCVRHNDKLVLR